MYLRNIYISSKFLLVPLRNVLEYGKNYFSLLFSPVLVERIRLLHSRLEEKNEGEALSSGKEVEAGASQLSNLRYTPMGHGHRRGR